MTRQLKSQPVKLQFWPLTGPLRMFWISWCLPSETMKIDLHREAWQRFYQNCESIPRRMECHMEVLLTTKGKRSREPYSQQPWQNCIHSWNVLVHASSSVDCAWIYQVKLQIFTWGLTQRTWWRQREQFTFLNKMETIHMISMLRKEACSGSIHDLAHITTQNCLADCLTKSSAKADNSITTVKTWRLFEVDVHPNFRTLMEHNAFLSTWCITFMHTQEKNVSSWTLWKGFSPWIPRANMLRK